MAADEIGDSVEGELVTGVQLLATHGANFAVDQHVAVLDLQLGSATGGRCNTESKRFVEEGR